MIISLDPALSIRLALGPSRATPRRGADATLDCPAGCGV